MNTLQRIGLFAFLLGLFVEQNFPQINGENVHKFEFVLFVTCAGAVAFVFPNRT